MEAGESYEKQGHFVEDQGIRREEGVNRVGKTINNVGSNVGKKNKETE